MTSYVVSLWFLYISCLGIQPSRGCFIKINTRIAWKDNFSYGSPHGVTLGHCLNYIHSCGKDPSTCGQQHSLGRRSLMVNYREKVSTGKQAYIPPFSAFSCGCDQLLKVPSFIAVTTPELEHRAQINPLSFNRFVKVFLFSGKYENKSCSLFKYTV